MTTFDTPTIIALDGWNDEKVSIDIDSCHNGKVNEAKLTIGQMELFLDKESMIKLATGLLMIAEGHTTQAPAKSVEDTPALPTLVRGSVRFIDGSKTLDNELVKLNINETDQIVVTPKTNEIAPITVLFLADFSDHLGHTEPKMSSITVNTSAYPEPTTVPVEFN